MAQITYAGLAPGLPGVYQLNVQVPETLFRSTSNALINI